MSDVANLLVKRPLDPLQASIPEFHTVDAWLTSLRRGFWNNLRLHLPLESFIGTPFAQHSFVLGAKRNPKLRLTRTAC